MIVKYPLTVNGESRNVRVAGTHQVLGPTEILSGVRVLRVSDDETPGVGEAESLGGGGIQVVAVLEPSRLGLRVTSGSQALHYCDVSLGNLRAHRHHSEIFLQH